MPPQTEAPICITGAPGFVGSSVLARLLQQSFDAHALVNQHPLPDNNPRVQSFAGGLFDPTTVDRAMAGCHAAIHLVGIIAEQPKQGVTFQRMHVDGTRAVIEAAQRAGVRRYLHMSALGTRPAAAAIYHQTKWQAEQLVRASGLDWTIFRPSLIHGPSGGFVKMEAAWARGKAPPFLFMPYFASGLFGQNPPSKLQPVWVEDVARAFVDAIDNPTSVGQTYDLVGPDVLSWADLHRTCATILTGHSRPVLPIPAWFGKTLAAIAPPSLLPFNRDQIVMALEDNTGNPAPHIRDFHFEPAPMEPTMRAYAASLTA
jgi:NADH dehydrogenase